MFYDLFVADFEVVMIFYVDIFLFVLVVEFFLSVCAIFLLSKFLAN